MPAGAVDCHHHIYDPRFPPSPHWDAVKSLPADAPVAAYRQLRRRLGIARSVVVQPSTYGIDNRCLVDALHTLGDSARGIAVVDTDVTDAELARLHQAGVRGVRVNFLFAQTWGVTTPAFLRRIAARVAPLGWHVQVLMNGTQIGEQEAMLAALPVPVVFDHLGRIPQPGGVEHPGCKALQRLLGTGRAWVKLSGLYADSKVGASTYADSGAVARAYLRSAPERVVWGSDWPHPTEKHKPDDALMLDLVAAWAGDDRLFERILVDNPEALYGFRAA